MQRIVSWTTLKLSKIKLFIFTFISLSDYFAEISRLRSGTSLAGNYAPICSLMKFLFGTKSK